MNSGVFLVKKHTVLNAKGGVWGQATVDLALEYMLCLFLQG